MANIPQYTSKESVIKEGSQVQKNVSEEVRYGAGSNMQSIGGGISDLGKGIADMQARIKKVNNDNVAFKAELAKKQFEMEDEQNRDKIQDGEKALSTLDDDVRKNTEEVAKQISDPNYRNIWKQEQSYKDGIYIINQRAKVAKKVVQLSRVNSLTKANMSAEKAYTAPIEDVPIILEDIKTKLKESGVFTPAEVETEYNKIAEAIRTGRPETAIYNDMSTQEQQSQVLADLKDTNGPYSNLTHDERVKLVKEAQSRIHTNNQKFKAAVTESQEVRLDNVNDKFYNNSLSLADLEAEKQIKPEEGGLDPKTIGTLKNNLINQKKSQLEAVANNNKKAKNLMDSINTYVDPGTQREQALEILSNLYSDGLLSPDEAKTFHNMRKYVNDVVAQKRADAALNGTKWFLQLGTQAKDSKEAVLNLKKFLSDLQQTDGSEQSIIRVMDNTRLNLRIQKYPWIKDLPKEGEVRLCPDRIERRFFPDGRIEAVK